MNGEGDGHAAGASRKHKTLGTRSSNEHVHNDTIVCTCAVRWYLGPLGATEALQQCSPSRLLAPCSGVELCHALEHGVAHGVGVAEIL
jgi:hypothetical protein